MQEPSQPGREESPPDQDPQIDSSPGREDPQDAQRQSLAVVARYGMMKQLGLFKCSGDEIPRCGSKLVVRTERGVELAGADRAAIRVFMKRHSHSAG